MAELDDRAWRELGDATAALADALQVVLLYAAGLDRALCDTHWQPEAAGLLRAAGQAADALARLRTALGQSQSETPLP